MRIWRLRIQRFRGILDLDWHVLDRIACLVGPGDTAKTTILDAVTLVATGRSGLTFDDSDFYLCNVDEPFVIEATFGDIPRALMADERFGLELGGVDLDGNLFDEMGDYGPTLTVRLQVDDSLEAAWTVISARNPDGRPISARDRAAIGVVRVGDSPNRQFTWARGSALARGAGTEPDVSTILSSAHRDAVEAVSQADLTGLDPAVMKAREAATKMGTHRDMDALQVGLNMSPSTGASLVLHDNVVPVGAAGLGTRRLLAVGLEIGAVADGAVVCLDELEHGLEPHRIRHLIRTFCADLTPRDGPGMGQLLCTSHSATALEELGSAHVHIVRRDDGKVIVSSLDDALTPVVRANPEAFLARKVIVAEGKTEIGLVRAYDSAWANTHDGMTLANWGVAIVDGGGAASAPSRALALQQLGYPTLVLADSDAPLVPEASELQAAGCEVVQWSEGLCTEERTLLDLSWQGVLEAFDLVARLGHDAGSIIDAFIGSAPGQQALARAGRTRADLGDDLPSLLQGGLTEDEARRAFAAAAISKKWFKRVDPAVQLGAILAQDDAVPTSDLGRHLIDVETWCFDGA